MAEYSAQDLRTYVEQYINDNPGANYNSSSFLYDLADYLANTFGETVNATLLKQTLNSVLASNPGGKGANQSKAGYTFNPTGGKLKDVRSPEYQDYYLRTHNYDTLLNEEVVRLIELTNQTGRPLTKSEVLATVGDKNAKDQKYAYYLLMLDDNADKFGFDSTGDTYVAPTLKPGELTQEEQDTQDAREAAYNSYWNELYSLQDGTLGSQMLDNFTTAEQNAAMSNMQLAEAQYQQAAMDQAAVVKSITDQVRAERMAKLRAGMNEAQIANQDMQLMINNMNTLNTQMNTMNQNRLAAQQQYNLAQDTAYQQYLETAAGLGQVGAAYAASDAGDVYMQTLKRMRQTGENFATAQTYIQGLYNKEGTK